MSDQENKKTAPPVPEDIEDDYEDEYEEEEPKRGFFGKLIRNPIFWIVTLITVMITLLNYLEKFTNVEIHNQYKIF